MRQAALGTIFVSLVALTAAVPSVAAETHTFVRPHTGPLMPVPNAAPITDRVLDGDPTARKDAAAAATFPDGDGHILSIQFSDSYPLKTAADAQALATFFGSLPHGAEMSRLKVVVLTPAEVNLACGSTVLACYDPATATMFASGDGDAPGQAPNDFVMAHEYGHHLAANRINPPFTGPFGAGSSGPKYWASSAGVCPGVSSGYFSLDRTAGFNRFPGEVFAEAFAQRRFPGVVPWAFATNAPTPADFAAIDLDAHSPWARPTSSKFRGRFGGKGQLLRNKQIITPLDGDIEVRLKGPRKANYDLFLLTPDGKAEYSESTKRKSKETLHSVVCGQRAARVTVRRVSGAGKYKLTVKKP